MEGATPMAEDCVTMDMLDIRATAMAKEWCRMLALDPDQMIRAGHGKAARYLGYLPNMRRLLDAAEAALPFER